MTWGHDELAADLARKLCHDGKHFCWLDRQLIGDEAGARPDVLALPRGQYHRPQFSAFEVKVKRSDLMQDLNTGKCTKYKSVASNVVFAMPTGLAKAKELPPDVGVMFRSERGWRYSRRPPQTSQTASAPMLAKLLAVQPWQDPQHGRRLEESYWGRHMLGIAEERALNDYGKRFGRAAAKYVSDVVAGKDPLALATEQGESIIRRANERAQVVRDQMCELLDALGIPQDAPPHVVYNSIRQIATRLTVDGENAALYKALAIIRRDIDSALMLHDRKKDAPDV